MLFGGLQTPFRMATRFAISLYVSAAIAAGMVAFYPAMLHWFLLPVLACGVLIGEDAVEWLRGRMDLFDPVGILGVLGYYFFFLSPLLVVWWNHRLMYLPDQPDDYRPWLGGVAALNFLGLLVYRWFRAGV